MADETKILRSNTFEEWRHKTNEVSFDVGGNTELNDRLTNKLFSYDDVSGSNQYIITGSDDSLAVQTLEFELLPDTTLDNTSGYIILAHGTSLINIVDGNSITQSGGFSADVISSVTIDGKPKILIRNAIGNFNTSQSLASGSATISSSNVIRLVAESYKVGSVVVKTKAGNGTITRINEDLTADGFHIPAVSGRINLNTNQNIINRQAAVDVAVEGEVVYQHTSHLNSLSDIESDASFHATIYHASSTTIYVKVHSGSFSSSSELKFLNYDQASGEAISASLLDSFDSYSINQGHFVEFNSAVTANYDVTISARTLVDTINELQNDVGKIEDLTTDGADITLSINELEDAVRGVKSDYTLATDSDEGLVGGVNELEAAARGDRSATNYTITTESSEGFAGGINELDTALRSATMQSSNALVSATLTTTANDITTAINEHDTELGNISSSHMLTAANNVGDAIREIEEQIGEEDISAIDAGDTDNTIYGALNQLHAEIGNEDISAIDSGDTANTVSGALNQLHTEVGDVGGGLTGLAATNLTSAVDELRTDIGDVGTSGATLTTGTNIVATDLTAAVVELDTTIGSGVITGVGTEAAGLGNLTSAINAIDAGLGHATSYNDGHYGANTVAGTLGLLQDGLLRNDDEIYNLMQAIDGDRPGTINLVIGTAIPSGFVAGAVVTQPTGDFSATIAPNGVDNINKTIAVRDITGTFSSTLNLAQNGQVIPATNVVSMALVDTTLSVNGLAANNVRAALQEIVDTEIIAGDGLSGAGSLSQDRTIDLDLASGGGLTIITADSTIIPTNSASSWIGYNEVYLNNNQGQGDFQYGYNPNGSGAMSSTVRNKQKFTFSNNILSLAPNTDIYATNNLKDSNNNVIAQNAGQTDGNAYMKINTLLEDVNWHGRTINLTGDVANTFNINARYDVEVFVRYLLKVDNGVGQEPRYSYNFSDSQGVKASLRASDGDLTNNSFSLTLAIPNRTDPNLQGAEPIPQIGFEFAGINAKSGTSFAIGDADISNLTATISAAAGSGQLSVDSGVVRKVSNNTQTFNSNLQFTSGNTVTFGAGTTLDVGSGDIILGSGGELDVTFDTAFLGLNSGAANQGVRIDRSQALMGDIYTALNPPENAVRAAGQNADIVWNEGQVIANNGHRAWQLKGLTSGGAPSANTAAIATFYNLYEALGDSGEINLIWDAANQRFSAQLFESGIATNAGWDAADVTNTYGTETGIPQITVDRKGRITNVTDVSISTSIAAAAANALAAGIIGTSNEIVTATLPEDNDNILQIGLPDNVTIGSNLTISGTTAASSTATGALTVGGGVGIAGNLHVGGTFTVAGDVNFTASSLTTADNIIILNSDKTGAAGNETAGIEVERGDDNNVQLRWNDNSDAWELTKDGTTYSDIVIDSDLANSARITADSANTATAIVRRDADGDFQCRLVRQSYATTNNTINFIMTQVNQSTDNYIRPATPAKVRDAIHTTVGAADVNNSEGTVIQDVTMDSHGHVSALSSVDLDARYAKIRNGNDGTWKRLNQSDLAFGTWSSAAALSKNYTFDIGTTKESFSDSQFVICSRLKDYYMSTNYGALDKSEMHHWIRYKHITTVHGTANNNSQGAGTYLSFQEYWKKGYEDVTFPKTIKFEIWGIGPGVTTYATANVNVTFAGNYLMGGAIGVA